jgi:O-antigen ligase
MATGLIERLDRHGTRLALLATLSLPVLVIVSRSAAEAVLAGLAVAFLLRVVLLRDWSPLAEPWFSVAYVYWGWLVLTTLLADAGLHRLLLAVAWLRFPLAILAFSCWLLISEEARRWALRVSGVASGFVALETWSQFAFGRGLTGVGRAVEGYLTGPFTRPRVGTYLLTLMWPSLLAAAASLARRGGIRLGLGGLLIAFAVGAVLLSGQRVPTLLTLGVLVAAGLLLAPLRRPVALALLAAAILAFASPFLAPETFHRYAEMLPRQLAGFPDSHYGQILARSLALHEAAPWFGHGAEAFRFLCREERFQIGWGGEGDGGGAGMCVPHPHNFYLEALLDGGWVGLALFTLFQVLLLAGALRKPRALLDDPVRLGLVLSMLAAAWPIATMNAYAGIDAAALRCLVAGWALALARAASAR